jgi:hypothetical protein
MPSVTRSQASTERRASLRVPLDVPALLDSDRAHHSGRCCVVSTAGVVVAVDAAVPDGSEFDVYFELPSGLPVEARAVVIRTSAEGLVLRFVRLEARTRVALRAFCRPSGVGLSRLAVKFNA